MTQIFFFLTQTAYGIYPNETRQEVNKKRNIDAKLKINQHLLNQIISKVFKIIKNH